MKLSCGEYMVRGKNIVEKLEILQRCGFDGIEIPGTAVRGREEEIKKAVAKSKVRPSTICGYEGCLLDADIDVRNKAMEELKYLLSFSAEIGAAGVIMVPLFGPPKISDLSPYADAVVLEKKLLVELLKGIGEYAKKSKSILLVEPLNRYETHLLNRFEQAVGICKKVDSPYVKIMADFFHMSIEEIDIPKSIKKAGDYIRHIHLADSTRLLPGYGHTDFKKAFAALKKIGFKNYMALECICPAGPYSEDELKKCVEYLKKCMEG